MNREELLALAARCESAEGADRELDVAIWLALCGPADRQAYEEGLALSEQEAAFRADYMMDGRYPTASLDAAMGLVPEGWSWEASFRQGWRTQHASVFNASIYESTVESCAATPALALTAASLRAIAAKDPA